MLEVADLVRRVDTDGGLEGDVVGPLAGCRDLDRLGLSVLEVTDLEGLLAGEAERIDRFSFWELQRQHTHPDQVGAVDPLEALGDHRTDTEQIGALGCPVTGGTRAVLLAGEHHEGDPIVGVPHGRLVDRGLLARIS